MSAGCTLQADERSELRLAGREPFAPRLRALAYSIAAASDALSLELAEVAARAASSKTLEQTVVLNVGDLIGITDYFVVTSGRNDRQVRAIVDEVTKAVREAGGGSVRQVEGLAAATWVLLDFGDVIVHVFDGEARAFYDLERLWGDAPRVAFDLELSTGGVGS